MIGVREEGAAGPVAGGPADLSAGGASRLSDKIFAAFADAYALGAFDVAERLHAALALAERHGRPAGRAGALGEADLWMAFVEARQRYRAACAPDAPAAGRAAAAEAMRAAYDRWSRG